MIGTKVIDVIEPIHFSGPSPGDNSAIAEEEKKEWPKTSPSDQPSVTDQDEPHGAAQQRPSEMIKIPVQRPSEEEKK